MHDWPEFPLESFIDPKRSICYGIVQPGKPLECGVPIVRVNNFKEGRIDTRDALTISPEIERKYGRSRLRGGELLLTLVGTMGLSAIVPIKLRGWNVARAVGVVPLKENVDKRWINFVIRSQPSQNFIQTHANTTVQATFNLRDLARLPIPMPPDDVRRPASELLSALDDKIDLNRRMNETLESMARAVFKDWFVDFGPARAKAEGREPYLVPELWDLFPDRLGDEDIPCGWRDGTIGDCFHLTMGQSPPGSTYNENGLGLPFFQGRTDFGFRYPENRRYCTQPTRIAERDDTLVSVRAPVGDINMAWEKCCAGRGIAALRHKSGSRSFTYHSARELQQELRQYEHTGTVFGAINKKQFMALSTLEPPPDMIAAFETLVDPLDERIRKNVSENRTLEQTRDLLLPKLMSGEIRLSDAENAVEARGMKFPGGKVIVYESEYAVATTKEFLVVRSQSERPTLPRIGHTYGGSRATRAVFHGFYSKVRQPGSDGSPHRQYFRANPANERLGGIGRQGHRSRMALRARLRSVARTRARAHKPLWCHGDPLPPLRSTTCAATTLRLHTQESNNSYGVLNMHRTLSDWQSNSCVCSNEILP